jgi:hypothetical protein
MSGRGTVFGELVRYILNAGIVNLDGPAQRAWCRVSEHFRILKPIDLDRGNGCPVYDVPNRGNQPIMPPTARRRAGAPARRQRFRCAADSRWYGAVGRVMCCLVRSPDRAFPPSLVTCMVREEFIAEATGLLGC